MIPGVRRSLELAIRGACGLLPRAFRERFAADLELTLIGRARSIRRRRGAIRAFGFVLRNLVTILVVASLERLPPVLRWGGRNRRLPGREKSAPPGFLAGLRDDVGRARQGLRARPGYVVACAGILAVGLGATSGALGLVEAVLLRPLPFPAPDRLVALHTALRAQSWWSASPSDIVDWRARSMTLESVGFSQSESFTVTTGTQTDRIPGARVSANLLRVLGVNVVLGRDFLDSEDQRGAGRVALLGEGFWRREYGADVTIIGRSLVIDSRPHEIVGVAPTSAGLVSGGDPDVLVPRPFQEIELQDRRRMLRAIGRLTPGTTLADARADLAEVARAVQGDEPVRMAGWGVMPVPLREQLVARARPALMTFVVAAAFLLAVCTLNAGNLVLLRWASRKGEMAVRRSLGAGCGRLASEVLIETVVVAAAGGIVGTSAAVTWLVRVAPDDLASAMLAGSVSRVSVAIIGMALSLLVGLLLAIWPLLRLRRLDVAGVIHQRKIASNPSAHDRPLQRATVAVQFAVAVVLLAAALLAFQSLRNLQAVDPGFSTVGKLVVEVNLPPEPYDSPREASAFHEALRERLRDIGGIRAVGAITSLPLTRGPGLTGYHLIEGRPLPPLGEEPIGGMEQVTPGYFDAQGIAPLEGVGLDGSAGRVVVINQEMARQRWPAGGFLGQRLRFARQEFGSWLVEPYEIVGMVADARYELTGPVRPRVYVPLDQAPVLIGPLEVLVRTDRRDALELLPAIREAVRRLDPRATVSQPRTYEEIRAAALAPHRGRVLALGAFGVLATALSISGLCFVVGQAALGVRRELAIRKALGADGFSLVKTVAGCAWSPLFTGLVAGGTLAWTLPEAMATLLFQVPSVGPAGFLLTLGSLAILSVGAALVPARRALRVDTAELLRAE